MRPGRWKRKDGGNNQRKFPIGDTSFRELTYPPDVWHIWRWYSELPVWWDMLISWRVHPSKMVGKFVRIVMVVFVFFFWVKKMVRKSSKMGELMRKMAAIKWDSFFTPIFLDLRLFASPKKSTKKSPWFSLQTNPQLVAFETKLGAIFYHHPPPQVVPKQKRFRFVVPPGCQPGDVLTLQPTERLALNFRVPDNVEAFNVVTCCKKMFRQKKIWWLLEGIWGFPKMVGTTKSSILIGFSIIKSSILGYPYFLETPI